MIMRLIRLALRLGLPFSPRKKVAGHARRLRGPALTRADALRAQTLTPTFSQRGRRQALPSMRKLLPLLALLAALASPALAVQPDEVMKDPALEARALLAELRCMVCRNQTNLAARNY